VARAAQAAEQAATTTRSVHDAVDHWGRSVAGAPRRLADLVTAIRVRDQLLERVVTEVVRRDIREQRLPTNERRVSSPRLRAEDIDPFAVPGESLRAESEHVAYCRGCNGAGVCTCGVCRGERRVRCGACGGGGKVLKQYKKRAAWIACSVCRGGGAVACGGCGAKGSVTCSGCAGSGHQLVWLAYDQSARWAVQVEPKSPVVYAHRQLREPRFLHEDDLGAFGVVAEEHADGPVALAGYRDVHRPILRASAASLDPRFERINRQQYLSLAVVRRDARYSMCGASGEIVLSGKELVASRTSGALRPIQRRLALWVGSTTGLAISTMLGLAKLRGVSPYFARSNVALTMLWCLGIASAVPTVGAALRSVGARLRWTPLRRSERYAAAASAAAFASMIALGYGARPRVGEVARALGAGDVARAKVVVGALREVRGLTPDVSEAEDAVTLAEANTLAGQARWALLDRMAARGGAGASGAATTARTERLRQIDAFIARSDPKAAIAALDRDFPESSRTDAEIATTRARAYDAAVAACADDPCRVSAALRAVAAAATEERAQRLSAARGRLLDSLRPSEVSGETTLARLERLRALAAVAVQYAGVAPADAEIVERAKKAGLWARDERAKVAILGKDAAVAEELLGSRATTDGKNTWIEVDGARAYLVLDARKTCRGLYIVGGEPGARFVRGSVWSADHLLSQALGRPAVVKTPIPNTSVVSRWWEGGVSVVARWDGGYPEELRIGDAAP